MGQQRVTVTSLTSNVALAVSLSDHARRQFLQL